MTSWLLGGGFFDRHDHVAPPLAGILLPSFIFSLSLSLSLSICSPTRKKTQMDFVGLIRSFIFFSSFFHQKFSIENLTPVYPLLLLLLLLVVLPLLVLNGCLWGCSGGKDSMFNMVHCIANGHRLVALANLAPPPGIGKGFFFFFPSEERYQVSWEYSFLCCRRA